MVDPPRGVIGVWFRRNQQQMRHGLLKRKYTKERTIFHVIHSRAKKHFEVSYLTNCS